MRVRRPADPMPSRRRRLPVLTTVLAVVAGVLLVASPAGAAPPVYQITAAWAPGTPATTANGNLVSAVWRVNVNDSANPPANDPVANVHFTVTVQHGVFSSLPAPCLTGAAYTPPSAITNGGSTLVCNLGTQKEGTADVVQTPMVVSGLSGQHISATGTIDNQTASVPPIPISNVFGEDMLWNTASSAEQGGPGTGTDYGFDLEWTLRTLHGSDPGPQTVAYILTITNNDSRALSVGASNPTRLPCAPYNIGSGSTGHPWSGRNVANETAPFVTTCTLTPLTATTFRLAISGIDYSKTLLPTKDSTGASLGSVWEPVASGSIWLTLHNLRKGTGITLHASAPTYVSPSGKKYTDATGNNVETKTVIPQGTWSHAWTRAFTGSGGTAWDNSYRVAQGTQVQDVTGDRYGEIPGVPNTALLGECDILDYKYATFNAVTARKFSRATSPPVITPISGAQIWYYVGGSPLLNPASPQYDPNSFSCAGNAGWTTTKPANLNTVKAVRAYWRRSAVAGLDAQLLVTQTVRVNAPIGRDVWTWGATYQGWTGNGWVNPARDTTTGVSEITPVPGSRYHYTTGARDVLHVTGPTPLVSKSANPTTVTPGVPATFTLRYKLEGAANLTFNGLTLTDVLPKGMTYVPNSATPAPTVTTNAAGQQVLTWKPNGVPSNTWLTLRYQAVASSSVTPGQALTNTVTATFGAQRAVANAQVIVSTSGYTTLLKTPDTPFIPNTSGTGDGSGSWTVTLASFDPVAQPFTDVIDILPYNGDGRGTAFHGSYTIGQITPPAGATVYYTTTAPGSLTDDPAAASNGSAGSIAGNTVGWSTTYTPNATAIRIIGPALAPGANEQFHVPITTTGASPSDVYVNRAQARAGHTSLVMRTSAKIVMGPVTSYSIKKYVQDRTGVWHDADGIADAPAFQPGDTVHYKITVTNTGTQTITGLHVTDDKYATGAFDIATLTPGQDVSHTYSTVITASTPSPFINTACAAPADATSTTCNSGPCTASACPDPGCTTTETGSESGLTAQCNPAVIRVADYTTVKTADPASGSVVQPGQTIHYTITVTQHGDGPADAIVSDAFKDMLDDATYNNDAKASTGTLAYRNGVLGWTGTVGVGGTATITYSVTVKSVAGLAAGGNGDLHNPVTSPGCASASTCTTDHTVGWFEYSKVADPSSGTTVAVGTKVHYTVTVRQHGAAAVPGASLRDDMTDVLDDATYGTDAVATSGTVAFSAPTLTWTGDLAVGQTVRITYSVTVTGKGNDRLANVVTSTDKRGSCDTSIGCATHHPLSSPAGGVAATGSDVGSRLSLAAMLVGAGGLLLLAGIRRRRRPLS